ncbi:MAG: tol-pal system-associated acyl-CoA thioesterase [Gammaproteobacteria bacterium]|nr:tol-pal system-associated acyl-CoA thioesterase [Gammaproteobacteria bacterium]
MSEFRLPLRVYYEDTDSGGVVYHANYLKFMERCRCEWLAHLGFDVATLEKQGTQFVVREMHIQLHQPARLFDSLQVSCQALQVGKVKLQLEQAIYNQKQLLCEARIKLATLDSSSFKLAAMPESLRCALQQE